MVNVRSIAIQTIRYPNLIDIPFPAHAQIIHAQLANRVDAFGTARRSYYNQLLRRSHQKVHNRLIQLHVPGGKPWHNSLIPIQLLQHHPTQQVLLYLQDRPQCQKQREIRIEWWGQRLTRSNCRLRWWWKKEERNNHTCHKDMHCLGFRKAREGQTRKVNP